MNQFLSSPLFPLLLILAGVAYVVIHNHITAATLKAKLDGLGAQLHLVHAVASAPVSVVTLPPTPVVLGTVAAAAYEPAKPAPAAAQPPAAAPVPVPAGKVLWDPTGKTLTDFQTFRSGFPLGTKIFSALHPDLEVGTDGQEIAAAVAFDYSKNPPYPKVWIVSDVALGGTADSEPFDLPAGTYKLWEENGGVWFSAFNLSGVGSIAVNQEFTVATAITGARLSATCKGNFHNQPTQSATLQCSLLRKA